MADENSLSAEITLKQDKEAAAHLAKMAQAVSMPKLSDEQVWLAMWTCVASRETGLGMDVAALRADVGLSQFRARFPTNTT